MRWLGIDGGGTKTAFTLYDEQLNPLDRFLLPTCHYAQAGTDGARDVLSQGASRARACGLLGDEFGIGFSICGYGEDRAADRALEKITAELSGAHPYALMNDVEAAWAAGLELQDGIALIAGTGSIALGVRGDRQMRCGGWDYEIGDEGSGGWMGKQLLTAFTRQTDGRDERGPLYTMVRERLGIQEDFQVIARAREILPDRTRTATLSVLVTEAATQGDKSAIRILEQAAQEEADMVAAIVRELFADVPADHKIPVTYIGGTFKAGEAILGPLSRALPGACILTPPAHEPDLGAVLILKDRLERG